MTECTEDEWVDHVIKWRHYYGTEGPKEGSDTQSSLLHKNLINGEILGKVRYHDGIHKTYYINKQATP